MELSNFLDKPINKQILEIEGFDNKDYKLVEQGTYKMIDFKAKDCRKVFYLTNTGILSVAYKYNHTY